jgi:hypothetical protein
MLQRYDIVRNNQTNRLSIKVFAVLEKRHPIRDKDKSLKNDYSFIHEVSYDADIIRAAIKDGQKALISELRSDNFYPIETCAKIIAEKITGAFNNESEINSEIFFDDLALLPEGI